MSKTMHLFALGLSLVLVAGGAASAPPAKGRANAAVDGVNGTVLSPGVVFASWDSDKDKKLSLEEFSAGWARMERAAVLRQLKGQFDRHDANRNGAIDSTEYATLELIRKGGASAPAFASLDGDKSGGLDFKEYVALVAAMASKQPAPVKRSEAPATTQGTSAPAK